VHYAVEQHDVHAESSDSKPNVGIGSESEVEQNDRELLEHNGCTGWKQICFLPFASNVCYKISNFAEIASLAAGLRTAAQHMTLYQSCCTL